MSTYVGVDWGSNGWVCAIRSADGWAATKQPSILDVWHHYHDAEAILVDIPIGLPEQGRRACDQAAKEVLGSQGGRVFWTPPREAVQAGTYARAKAHTEDVTAGSMSTQAWALTPRIQEVDTLFAEMAAARGQVRESHPEICFATLNDGEPVVAAKTDAEGVERRCEILERHDEGARAAYHDLVETHIDSQPDYARRFNADDRDDLVDAMVLALTGWLADGSFATLPDDPPRDAVRDVPMEIVYPTF